MDSQIFTEPPLPDKLWKISMHCWHFHSLHLHIFINLKRSVIYHSAYEVGYNWGGYEHFSKDNKWYKAFWKLF